MCVVIYKPAGVEFPSYEIFSQCWETNPDGFGMAVADGEKVTLAKGYLKLETAWQAAHNVPTEHAALLHFRIGTSGKNDGPTCHPFPISNSKKDLRRLKFDSLPYAVVHNGIISSKGEGNLSDTQVWVRDKLSMLYKPELVATPYHSDLVQLFLDEAAESYSSRFAVLNSDMTCLIAGTWHEQDGLFFSNTNWKYVRRTYYGGRTTGVYDWWYGSDKKADTYTATASKAVSSKYISSYKDEDYYDDLNYGYTPACPYCGSYDTIAHPDSVNDVCECFECNAIFNGRTGDEYGIIFDHKEGLMTDEYLESQGLVNENKKEVA